MVINFEKYYKELFKRKRKKMNRFRYGTIENHLTKMNNIIINIVFQYLIFHNYMIDILGMISKVSKCFLAHLSFVFKKPRCGIYKAQAINYKNNITTKEM